MISRVTLVCKKTKKKQLAFNIIYLRIRDKGKGTKRVDLRSSDKRVNGQS